MLSKLINLLGGYTERDMHRKYLEGQVAATHAAVKLHNDNANLVGAAYKNKMRAALEQKEKQIEELYFNYCAHASSHA